MSANKTFVGAALLAILAEAAFLRDYMQSLLRERNTVLKQVAESPELQNK